MIKAVSDTDPTVCLAAIEALGRIGDREALEALGGIVEVQNSPLRHEAITALGVAGDPWAIPTLGWVIAVSESSDQRAAAARALGLIAEKTPDTPRHDHHRKWTSDALIVALGDEATGVRAAAVAALRRHNDPEALPALCAAMEDEHPEIRKSAVDAMDRLGAKPTAALLRQALGLPPWRLRAAAARGLKRLRDWSAAEFLCAALGDPEAPVRMIGS